MRRIQNSFMTNLVSFSTSLIGFMLTTALANAEDRGQAVVYACVSLVTEFEDGSRVNADYRAFLTQVREVNSERRSYQISTFALGPVPGGAGGGIFYNIIPNIFPNQLNRIKLLAEAINRGVSRGSVTRQTAHVPTGSEGPLFYIRPASEVKMGRSGLSVSEFECSQVLF